MALPHPGAPRSPACIHSPHCSSTLRLPASRPLSPALWGIALAGRCHLGSCPLATGRCRSGLRGLLVLRLILDDGDDEGDDDGDDEGDDEDDDLGMPGCCLALPASQQPQAGPHQPQSSSFASELNVA